MPLSPWFHCRAQRFGRWALFPSRSICFRGSVYRYEITQPEICNRYVTCSHALATRSTVASTGVPSRNMRCHRRISRTPWVILRRKTASSTRGITTGIASPHENLGIFPLPNRTSAEKNPVITR